MTNGLSGRFFKGGKRRVGSVQISRTDSFLEDCLGVDALIDGCKVRGFYRENNTTANLGGKVNFQSTVREFCFRRDLYPAIACGCTITILDCKITGVVPEGGLKMKDGCYVCAKLSNCKDC